NLVKNALPGSCNETEIDKVYKAVISEYRKTPVQKTSMYPEIPNLLNELTRLQIPMAILSNKLHEITIPIVSIILGKWKFEVVLGARNNIPKKPDPYSAIEIASTMNIPPSCCLFIGDSGTDVKTALACGMNPIGVSWGYRNIEDIKSAGADIIVHRPLEILNFIHI
ncbi:MAG: HAD-IA family hydrolase, partial [Spirochaetia bacterium]|nr:HAD-IA family hydrolase [Spirochaetia bacterium]